MLQFACVRARVIIGDAATKVSVETRDATPTIRWCNMIGMRNRIGHVCIDVSVDLAGQTATDELLALGSVLRQAVEER